MSFRAQRHLMSFVAALAVAAAMPGAASAASYGTRTLRIGAHGSDVKKLQRYLAPPGTGSGATASSARGRTAPSGPRSASSSWAPTGSQPPASSVPSGARSGSRAAGGAAYVEPPPPEKAVRARTGT